MLYLERKRDCRGGKRIELPKVEYVSRADTFIGAPKSLVATSRWESTDTRREIALRSKPVRSDGKRNVGNAPLDFVASTSDFAAFMGMYLSEGSLGVGSSPGNYPISIWQTQQGKGIDIYRERLEAMLGRKVAWYHTKGVFRFFNKALYEYLKTLGGYAWTKRIPAEVLELGTEDLETFWHYYWLGDGSMMSSEGRRDIEVQQTTSKAIADSFQEILQKLGGWSKVHTVSRAERHGSVCGVPVKARHTLYRVVRRAGTVAFPTHVERVPYRGLIGCASVPAGSVYVRRNDHPVWAGSA
jgi:hypothetical protein